MRLISYEKSGYNLPLIIYALVMLCLFTDNVYASGMWTVVCHAAGLVQGEIAAGIATLGILTIGAGACFGKVSWPMAIVVGAGITGLFGAADVAAMWAGTKCPYY